MSGMSVMQIMQQGGWVMWVLLVLSAAALSTAVERSIVLNRAGTDLKPFLVRLRKALIEKGSSAKALELCHNTRGAAARLAAVGVHRLDKSSEHLERALETHALVEARRLRRGLGILATTVVTAPLLGFLGTVLGMMDSFQVLADLSITQPSLVAEGIKEALTTTAGGLIVAVPAQLLSSALNGRLEGILQDLEETGAFLMQLREETH